MKKGLQNRGLYIIHHQTLYHISSTNFTRHLYFIRSVIFHKEYFFIGNRFQLTSHVEKLIELIFITPMSRVGVRLVVYLVCIPIALLIEIVFHLTFILIVDLNDL